jgi:UDP-N-acetylmuramoylalanine--D-glutamate ligase
MIEVRGKRVLVVGLARTGIAAAKVLARQGAAVTVSDARPPWELRADMRELLVHKIGVEMGLHRQETFLSQDLIIVSPGVLPDLPQLEAARQRQIPVVSEVEAASWFLDSPLIGITGSNGKTTTTSLLGEILEASAFPAFVGGNIGVPLISAVGEVTKDTLVVTELSSFQLEGTQTFRPRVAVLLNITPNHLDRHPTLEAYVRAKARIFANQTSDDFAILNADDPAVMSIAPSLAAQKIFFSRRELPDGVFAENGHVIYRTGNLERMLLTTREIQLRGEFNVENVMAAAAAACVLGADFEAIRRGVSAFRGVEHRLEFVRALRGVQFYNDSKATSVDAAAKALSAFTRGVHLILGGKDKGAPYAPIRQLLEGRVREVYLIGAAAERIEKQLSGAVGISHSGDLETAVHDAFARAAPGDVVLLSPACASFDQFQDYEHRGRVFKEIVARLTEEPVEPGFGIRDSRLEAQEPGVGDRKLNLEMRSAETLEAPTPVQAPERKAAVVAPQAEVPEIQSIGDRVLGDSPQPRIPNPESGIPTPEAAASIAEPPAVVPERIYFYEVAAEEVEYPEPEILVDYGGSDAVAANVEPLPQPQPVVDEALPFEVRPKSKRAPGASKQRGESTKEAQASPVKSQTKLPGI